MSSINTDNILIPVPAWVLKTKIETDFEEFMFFHNSDDPEEGQTETFPNYDSSKTILEELAKVGIEFDTKTGLWKE